MKCFLNLCLLFIAVSVDAGDAPIIFIHGNNGEGSVTKGWGNWYKTKSDGSLEWHTAMTKILSEHYKGYNWGLTINGEPAKFCDINTQLMPNQGRKNKIGINRR